MVLKVYDQLTTAISKRHMRASVKCQYLSWSAMFDDSEKREDECLSQRFVSYHWGGRGRGVVGGGGGVKKKKSKKVESENVKK